jgi:outer membrane lipoprotein-sorting protein
MSILRRLPLSRLLLLCGLVVAIGVSATALALAVSSGPTPPPKPLAEAVHDALAAPPVTGVSARIQLTDHLLEGANLSGGSGGEPGQLANSPLISGASGRLWIGSDGRVRLELQSEQGDTQILYDGHTITLYDASSNTVYRYTPPQDSSEGSGSEGAGQGATGNTGQSSGSTGQSSGGDSATGSEHHAIPTVQEIQEGISRIMQHATLSGATPSDVAGQPAYTVRISPSRNGGLIGGAELSWDANTGVPLRVAVYSTTSSSPVIELTATEISYGAVESSVFDITPPASAKVEEIGPSGQSGGSGSSGAGSEDKHTHVSGLTAVQGAVPFTLDAPATLAGMTRGDVRLVSSGKHPAALVTYGEGLGGIALVESQAKAGATQSGSNPSQSLPEGLPQVKLTGATATELPTPLGTLLQFERGGVSYLLAGSVTPATIEAAAKGL